MTVQTDNKADRSPGAQGSHRKKKNQIDEGEFAEVREIAGLAVKWASENPDSDSARAIMQLAADRAKRLGEAAKSDAKRVITTPKALFEFLNTEYIDTLDDVFGPESEPEEFASKLRDFASEIARAFHAEEIRAGGLHGVVVDIPSTQEQRR